MDTTPLDLPDDIEALQALVRQYQGELSSQSKAYEATIAQLREQLQLLVSQRFGSSSEKVADADPNTPNTTLLA